MILLQIANDSPEEVTFSLLIYESFLVERKKLNESFGQRSFDDTDTINIFLVELTMQYSGISL